jgi:hypothetical protein
MAEGTEQPNIESSSARDRALAIGRRIVGWIPAKARLAVAAGGCVLTAAAMLYSWLFTGSATLNLVCRHNLRSAELAVYVDGDLRFTEQLSGSAVKRFGVFGKRLESTFSKSLKLESGEHLVQVHLTSAEDGFDQSKSKTVNVAAGAEGTLYVSTPDRGMSLIFDGAEMAGSDSSAGNVGSVARSILITVFGSAFSAAIAFVVQEFLRTRKRGLSSES